FLNN
ncbi:putative hemoglobin and hemoglobin-haptoglobin-binding protein 3 precursor, partial [Haemophilus influenzae]